MHHVLFTAAVFPTSCGNPYRALLLAVSRDPSVVNSAAVRPAPLVSYKSPTQQQQLYPASGILPFQGLSAFVAPLCYLYNSPAATYPVFKELYCRYWCRLHTLDVSQAPKASLAVLCRTFLDVLQVRLRLLRWT